MAHYVLHDIGTGDLIRVSEVPFTSTEVGIGQAVEFIKSDIPVGEELKEFEWNPKYLMWKKRA